MKKNTNESENQIITKKGDFCLFISFLKIPIDCNFIEFFWFFFVFCFFMTVIKYILKVHLYAIKKIALFLSTQLTVDPYVIQFFFLLPFSLRLSYILFFIFSYVTFLFNGSDFYFYVFFVFIISFLFLYFTFFFTISTPWPKEQFYFCLFLLCRKIGQKLFQFVIFLKEKNKMKIFVAERKKKRNTSTQKSIITTAHSCHFVLCLVVSRVKGRRYWFGSSWYIYV